MAGLAITWFGHATFVLTTPGGKRIVFDPWLPGNPEAPPDAQDRQGRRHPASRTATPITPATSSPSRARPGAPVVAVFELANWFQGKGLKDVIGMGIGGTVDVKGLKISMTPAVHTSSIEEDGKATTSGSPTGFVVRLEDGRAIYFAGDTALFGDMRLIRELYAPEIAFLPIGDHYTMDPEAAAKACDMLGVRQVVPMHYGTFPGSPARPTLKRLVEPRASTCWC